MDLVIKGRKYQMWLTPPPPPPLSGKYNVLVNKEYV